MYTLILKAVVTGLILSIMLGPVFFVLLETSIRRGIRAALAFDAGVFVSDLIYILIAYLFFSEIANFSHGRNEHILRIIGGLLFIVFGLTSFFKKSKDSKQDDSGNIIHNSRDYIVLFVKGLFLNLANPLIIFYWFSVMALAAKESTISEIHSPMLLYLGTLLFVFFSIDVLKIFGAKKLRPFITQSVLRLLNRVTSTILFLFGIVLITQGILEYV